MDTGLDGQDGGEPTILQVHYAHNDRAVYARFCYSLGGGFRSTLGGLSACKAAGLEGRLIHDKAGNRTTEQIDDAVTTTTYNNANEMTSITNGGALSFKGSVNELASVEVGWTFSKA